MRVEEGAASAADDDRHRWPRGGLRPAVVAEELRRALLLWADERGLPVAVVGLGFSNLLAADAGVDALVLRSG